VKSTVKSSTVEPTTSEAAMKAAAVEAASAKAASVEAATTSMTTTTTATATAAVTTTAVTAATAPTSECSIGLNQADSCQCEQGNNRFPHHASSLWNDVAPQDRTLSQRDYSAIEERSR
jgi:hypothetical protein